MEKKSMPPQGRDTAQLGFTLVELMLGMALTIILMTASGTLLRDYMSSAKTIQVAADASSDLVNLLRDIRRVFQTSVAGNQGNQRRACILTYNGNGDRSDPANYACANAAAAPGSVRTGGLGFALDVNSVPRTVFLNACEAIPDDVPLLVGRGGVPMGAPRMPTEIENMWGSAAAICPNPCPANSRPVIRFFNDGREIRQRQVPDSLFPPGAVAPNRAALNHWGAMICGIYFSDTQRRIQGLFGENAGAFTPDYMTTTIFLARARFDIIPRPGQSPYIWVHGGLTLEFNDGQEMSVFKCPPRRPLVPIPPGC